MGRVQDAGEVARGPRAALPGTLAFHAAGSPDRCPRRRLSSASGQSCWEGFPRRLLSSYVARENRGSKTVFIPVCTEYGRVSGHL